MQIELLYIIRVLADCDGLLRRRLFVEPELTLGSSLTRPGLRLGCTEEDGTLRCLEIAQEKGQMEAQVDKA